MLFVILERTLFFHELFLSDRSYESIFHLSS